MPSGACIRKRGGSGIQLLTMHPQPELTDGSSATACFQMSVQLQSQTSFCQTIMEWQLQCHLRMHLPAGQGFGQCIISHAAFKSLMAARIQTFLQAIPVTTTFSRAARWDKLKVDIPDVARSYCSTIHAQRIGQLRVLRVRASQARAAYVAAPGSHHALDALRHTALDLLQHRRQQAATGALRAGVLLHEYGDKSYCFHHLHRQRQQATILCHLQQQHGSPVADLCTMHGRQQADSIIVNFFSADIPTGMFRQLPTDLSAQKSLLSSLDRQLPSEAQQACQDAEQGSRLRTFRQLSSCLPVAKSRDQTACPMSSSPSSGRCWAHSCWQSCKMRSKLSMASACQPA